MRITREEVSTAPPTGPFRPGRRMRSNTSSPPILRKYVLASSPSSGPLRVLKPWRERGDGATGRIQSGRRQGVPAKKFRDQRADLQNDRRDSRGNRPSPEFLR